MRLLLVGDPHVTVEELDDAQALLDGVLSLYDQLGPDKVIFMGDLHHNHAVVRVEVTDFWLRNLARFPKDKVILILGNHDKPNDASSTAHALQSYTEIAQVIDRTCYFAESKLAIAPYKHNKSELVEDVLKLQKSGLEILLCHATFDGSKYENGFYAPDGLDPRLLGVKKVISGHIHRKQLLTWEDGWVHYIGSPRWRSISDANEGKSIILYDTELDSYQEFDTSQWCSPISKASILKTEDLESVPFLNNPNARLYLDVVGPKTEVEVLVGDIKSKYPKAKLRPVYTDQSSKKLSVTESEGVFNALRRYISNYKSPYGNSSEFLQEMITKRISNVTI